MWTKPRAFFRAWAYNRCKDSDCDSVKNQVDLICKATHFSPEPFRAFFQVEPKYKQHTMPMTGQPSDKQRLHVNSQTS